MTGKMCGGRFVDGDQWMGASFDASPCLLVF